jgi:AbiU2
MTEIDSLIQIWIKLKFQVMEFETFFPADDDIEKLRGDTIPDFFTNINELYWHYFLITIARLLDKSKHNLTLFILPQILERNGFDNKPLLKKISNLNHKFKDITFYRNKYLAHLDINYTTGIENFNTSTHIDDVNYFLEEMLSLIRETQELLSLEKFSGIVLYPGLYRGSCELIKILKLFLQPDK